MFIALVLVMMNFIADLLYTVLDPRVAMVDTADPVLPATAPAALLVLRRMAAMPARDPLAIAGVLIYVAFVLVAMFADVLAPTIRSRSCSSGREARGERAAEPRLPARHHQSRPRHLSRNSCSAPAARSMVGLVRPRSSSPSSAPSSGSYRAISAAWSTGADAARRHRARHPVPALRHRARGHFSGRTYEHRPRHRAAAVAQHGARHPHAGADLARTRLRGGGARHRRQPWRIIFVHIAPNILPLSLLYGVHRDRLGDPDRGEHQLPRLRRPDSVSWGYDAAGRLCLAGAVARQYNWFVPPGVCIVLVVVAGFFISRGYEEILFPKLKD